VAFTEFYCNTGGSNLNSGSSTGTSASFTYAGGTFVRSTGVFTVASGDPASDGVTVGDFASIYTTSGATVATCVGRITARDATTITISITALSGATSAVSESAGATTCKVGGAWQGPNGSVAFPFGFAAAAMMNASSEMPRVNFISGTNYAITANMTHSIAGPVRFEGYTTSPGDGGRAIIDGGTSGASYVLLTLSGHYNYIAYMTFQNNGATGSSDGMTCSGESTTLFNVVVNSVRATGINCTGNYGNAIECEVYGIGQGGNKYGFEVSQTWCYVRCISHDNTGTNGGYYGDSTFVSCIADSNGYDGWITASIGSHWVGCTAYANGRDGIRINNSAARRFCIESSSFVLNGGYGINGTGSGGRAGHVLNCGFGSGTKANTSGTTTSLKGMYESGTVTFTSNTEPWSGASTGDFRINLAGAKGTGRGSYCQTASSYTGAVGYPDIGAAQHQDTGGGGSGLAITINGGLVQ